MWRNATSSTGTAARAPAAISNNLRWTVALIWTCARTQALAIVAVHILLKIQPALLAYDPGT